MNRDEQQQVDEWVSRYQEGTLDKESLKQLTRWASLSEENRLYVRNQLEVWFSVGVAGNPIFFDKGKAYQRFMNRRLQTGTLSSHKVRSISWNSFLRVAAVILMFVLPLAGYWSGKESVKHSFADISVEAPMGARTKLYLPDGTLVWLNAGSKLVYSQGFGVDDRKLAMEGEGYFEVTRNEQLPFEIQTKEVGLRVLGTKFNFRNYSDDEEVTVNLMEGKVSLHNEMKEMAELCLEPNEKMVLNKQTGEMIKSSTRASQSNVWINDELLFDEDLLEDIAKRLMRSFAVKIEVADSLRNHRFYGSFKVQGSTIDEVLSVIASTHQMRYRYEDGKYILY